MKDPIAETSYIYARKSEEDKYKQVESIPRQIAITKKLASQDNIVIPPSHILTEEQTGKMPGRPVFNKLMDIVENNEHTTIYCWLFNRMGRNSKDLGVVKHCIETGRLTIVMPDKIFDENQHSVVLGVEGDTGTQYSRDLSRMAKDTNKQIRANGKPNGLAPVGWRNAGEYKGRRWWEPDVGNPNRFLLIQKAISLVMNGTDPMDAFRTLNEIWGFTTIKRRKKGGGPLPKSTWYTLLRDPVIYGTRIAFDGKPNEEWYKLREPHFVPMFSEEEYWKLQKILDTKGRPRPRLQGEERGVFSQLLMCGSCGKMMNHDPKRQIRCVCKNKYGARQTDTCPKCGLHESKVSEKRKHIYDYWACQTKGCPQSVITTEEVEQQIVAALDSVTIPQEFIDWALEYLDEANDEEIALQEATLKSLQNAYELKQQELRRLNQLYVKGGYDYEGGEQEYQDAKRKVLAEKNTTKKHIDEYDVHADDWREHTERGYLFCKEAAAAFSSGDYRTKRDIFITLCEKAVVKGKKLVLTIEPPFKFIKKKLDKIKTKFVSTEPEIITGLALDTANKSFADAVKLEWLLGPDSNRQPTG